MSPARGRLSANTKAPLHPCLLPSTEGIKYIAKLSPFYLQKSEPTLDPHNKVLQKNGAWHGACWTEEDSNEGQEI